MNANRPRGLYVYGIVDRSLRMRRRGMFGRPLRTVRAAGLHAIVEAASRRPKASLPKLRAQGRVVAAIVEAGGDMLPARFGAFVAGGRELEASLAGRRAELRSALAAVRGCVQMTLRVPVPSARGRGLPRNARERGRATGGAYLRARAAEARARRRAPLLRALARAAAPYVRASRVEWREGMPLVSLHHLVPRREVEAYAAALARELERRGAHGVLSGPMAPFAFAEIA